MNETKDETTERLGPSLPQSDPPSAPTPWDTRAAGDRPSGTALGSPRQNLDVITYTTDVEDLRPDQLGGFFVGWSTPPSRHQFAAVLRSSYRAVVALDSTTGRVVGFITAISDGVLTAFLPWLEVLPDYQGRGIGTQLLRRMLAELDHLYSVDLICDPRLRKFYERAGMIPLQGMGLRDTDALDGES